MRSYVVIALIVLALYVYSYYLHPGDIQIVQTRAATFTSNMLLDKQPVVIEDADADFITTIMSSVRLT